VHPPVAWGDETLFSLINQTSSLSWFDAGLTRLFAL